jgi:hypothetical protein
LRQTDRQDTELVNQRPELVKSESCKILPWTINILEILASSLSWFAEGAADTARTLLFVRFRMNEELVSTNTSVGKI